MGEYVLRPGLSCTTYANQAVREAVILAVRGDEMLIEYSMPHGSTALRLVDINSRQERRGSYAHFEHGAKQSYWSLSLAWLQAVVDGGQEWEGSPQQAPTVPEPSVLLEARLARRDTTTPAQQAEQSLNCIHRFGEKLDYYHVYRWVKLLYRKQAHSYEDIMAYMVDHYGWQHVQGKIYRKAEGA